jgi:hypothetical protein
VQIADRDHGDPQPKREEIECRRCRAGENQ